MQVYVEQIYDLFAETSSSDEKVATRPGRRGSSEALTLREDKEIGTVVEGAMTRPAASAEECLDLLQLAQRNLKFASTKMNRHSSRSHAVCRIHVELEQGKHTSSPGLPPMLKRGDGKANGLQDMDKWRRTSVESIEDILASRGGKVRQAVESHLSALGPPPAHTAHVSALASLTQPLRAAPPPSPHRKRVPS